MDLKFIKDRYDFELQRREQLTAQLTLPVGVLSLLGGAIAAMARSFSYMDQRLLLAFDFLAVPAVAAFFVCAYSVARAYHAQSYQFLPLLRDLETWEDGNREWRAYVEGTGGTLPPKEEDFDSFLRSRMINAADANTKSNDDRSGWMHRSRIWLFVVFCLTALAGIPFVVDQVRY